MNWQPIWKNVFGETPGSDDIKAMNEFAQLCHPHLDDPLSIIAMFLQRQYGLLMVRSGELVFNVYQLEEVLKRFRLEAASIAGMANALVAATRSAQAQVERVAQVLYPLTNDVLRKLQVVALAPAVSDNNQPRPMLDSRQWNTALRVVNGCAWVVALTIMVVLATGRPQAVTPEAAAASRLTIQGHCWSPGRTAI